MRLKDPTDFHMESATRFGVGGVAAVKNSRRLYCAPDWNLLRRSVLDTPLNPQCCHSHRPRELDGPGHAPH